MCIFFLMITWKDMRSFDCNEIMQIKCSLTINLWIKVKVDRFRKEEQFVFYTSQVTFATLKDFNNVFYI